MLQKTIQHNSETTKTKNTEENKTEATASIVLSEPRETTETKCAEKSKTTDVTITLKTTVTTKLH